MRILAASALTLVCLASARAQGTAEPAAPVSPAIAAAPSHVLAPGELVQIKVFQEPDLDTAVRIPSDGRITFPLIGEVTMAGETVQGATRTIHDRLQARFLVNPQVTISVIEQAKRLFTVLGQVQRPGTYRFPESQSLDVLQVVGIAGGYTRVADPGKITLKRRTAGEERVFRLDGKRLARGQGSELFLVVPGDVITVGERLF
ncbi:MAG: polysaccharide biosynthesis/export family protein [Verrucomicrobiota bacterium]|nr:polysaccharide biosynthesis/export family protein [Verrucomicrobiota bacterium]